MTDNEFNRERGEYFYQQHTTDVPPGFTAGAEQHDAAMREAERACARYNGGGKERLSRVPRFKKRLEGVYAKLRETQRRDAQLPSNYGGLIRYVDDRNTHDELAGWVPYDPDNPFNQGVMRGVIVGEIDSDRTPKAVYILRGGAPAPHQKTDQESPDFGPGLDFETFVREAEQRHSLFRMAGCDMRLPDGCDNTVVGLGAKFIAVPQGLWIYMIAVCDACLRALGEEFTAANPPTFVGNVYKTDDGRILPVPDTDEPDERIEDWKGWTGGLDGKGVPPQ